jgi:isopentenyl phosphate kinase
MSGARIVFVKLGGSLITDKTQPMTPRPEVIQRLADEIAQAMAAAPGLQLLIGHGSGSFGHAVANQYQTQSGGKSQDYWRGFSEVWAAARELNQIVIKALIRSGLPVIAFPPSASIITRNTQIQSWDIGPIQAALAHNLVPVVYGDVIFDTSLAAPSSPLKRSFNTLLVYSPSRSPPGRPG